METLACGHPAYVASRRACLHLAVEEPPEHYRMLTGIRMDYNLLCRPCSDSVNPESHLREICEGCLDRLEEPFEVLGWRGDPQIVIRDVEQQGKWTATACPAVPLNDRCLAALPDGWLVLTEQGLVAIDDDESRNLGPVNVRAEEHPDKPWMGRIPGPALHTSPDGRRAAVVYDYARYGTVVDTSTGRTVLQLDRQNYHNETTPFPIAFLGTGHATKLLAATNWNRLDLFDAVTGNLLTDSASALADGPDGFMSHVFHGRLTVSPLGHRVLVDGWVWHPAGMPSVIELQQWLTGSYQAPLIGQKLTQRMYAWDQPVAWVDENTVAIQRIGDDDEAMIDGVELYDVTNDRPAQVFAGPSGRMWGHSGRLFVASEAGLEIWDPSGARVGLVEGFAPTALNSRTGTFAEVSTGRLRTWQPLPQ